MEVSMTGYVFTRLFVLLVELIVCRLALLGVGGSEAVASFGGNESVSYSIFWVGGVLAIIVAAAMAIWRCMSAFNRLQQK
jgi:hypothetical protein